MRGKQIVSLLVSGFIITSPVISTSNDTGKVFRKVANSVVVVKALLNDEYFAQGSGVLLDDAQTIITNLHVVDESDQVIIEFPDGRKFRAKGYIAFDSKNDLITIRLPMKVRGIEAIEIGDVKNRDIGNKVIAIGNPKGLSNTVSEGIISAVRDLDSHTTVIQTTAAMSSGSSGGGLFDMNAKLIGITSFLYIDGQNLNFAYPANYIKPLIKNKPPSPFYQIQRTNANKTKGVSVYLSKTGKKYHKSTCSYLNKNKRKMHFSGAVEKGYSPCKRCWR